MVLRWLTPFRSDDDGQNPGTGSSKKRASDVLEQHGGDALKIAEKHADVLNDNHALRRERAALKDQIASLEAAKPADGAVVLSGDDAARWQAYQQLGTVDDLTAAHTELETAKADLAKLQRDAAIRAAAEAHGYVPSALAKLPSLAGKDIAIRAEQDADGKPVTRAYVDDALLSEYVQQHDPEFVPSLKPAQPAPGVVLPPQRGGGGTPTTPVDQFIAHRDARQAQQVNPLLPPKGTA